VKARETSAMAERAPAERVCHTEKRGRRATGHDPPVTFRLPRKLAGRIDEWAKWNGRNSRSEAMRWLLEYALKDNPSGPKTIQRMRPRLNSNSEIVTRALGIICPRPEARTACCEDIVDLVGLHIIAPRTAAIMRDLKGAVLALEKTQRALKCVHPSLARTVAIECERNIEVLLPKLEKTKELLAQQINAGRPRR
jgi:hypothetical protein